jgi:hypothetical protein
MYRKFRYWALRDRARSAYVVNHSTCLPGKCFSTMAGCLLAIALLVASDATATPLISELLYDAVGSDNGLSFVEIYGTPGESLEGVIIEGINGSNGSVVNSIALSGQIQGDGLFVLADIDGDGLTQVANYDGVANFDFQNGPDSVQLVRNGLILDAVGYGEFAPDEFFAGEGASAPDVAAGQSLARVFADVDSDDNASDFQALDTPTPGVADVYAVPEPAAALMTATGLVTVAILRRQGY